MLYSAVSATLSWCHCVQVRFSADAITHSVGVPDRAAGEAQCCTRDWAVMGCWLGSVVNHCGWMGSA